LIIGAVFLFDLVLAYKCYVTSTSGLFAKKSREKNKSMVFRY
jgi:hypothetical protein